MFFIDAICLTLLEWLVIMNDIFFLYVSLVFLSCVGIQELRRKDRDFPRQESRGHYYNNHDDNVGLYVGQSTSSISFSN